MGLDQHLKKGKAHYPTHWNMRASSHLPEIHSLLTLGISYTFPYPGFPIWGPSEIDLVLWKGEWLPRTPLAKQGHLERSDVKLWLKDRLGPACRAGPESHCLENFALFLPLVGRVLLFLIDSRCVWYGCLAPKSVCPDNCRRSRDTQPSITSDGAASYSSCIVYEMSHFHSKSKSELVLDLTDTSHFILLILSPHMLVQLLSSSLSLLRWNWETQRKVIFLEQNHCTWLPRSRVVQQACVFSFSSSGNWRRKKWMDESGGCHACLLRKRIPLFYSPYGQNHI